jgi:phosphatidylserine decarboxylase
MTEQRWPIAKEALPFLIPAAFLTLVFGLWGWKILALFGILLTLFIAYFFRNPKRNIPALQNAILSPADGKVIYVGECQEKRYLQEKALKISIFMSIFDVHINRSPISGKVLKTVYNPGEFFVAHLEKSSLLNEQNAIIVLTEDRFKILVVQIAGLVARRIVCYPKIGDFLKRGEIFGLIRFGSRVDLYLPLGVKINVQVGRKVKGGESIIGYRL